MMTGVVRDVANIILLTKHEPNKTPLHFTLVMSDARPSRRFCAAQEAFQYCVCAIKLQPAFILVILNWTF